MSEPEAILNHPDEDVRRMAHMMLGLPVYPTRDEIIEALDAGRVWFRWFKKWRRIRRSGKTKLWKSHPDRWLVPFQTGLGRAGENGYLDEDSIKYFEPLSGKSNNEVRYKISATDPTQMVDFTP